MGKGKVIGTVAAAVVIPAAAVVGAIYILPLAMMLLLPQTAQYRSARRKCLATARNTPTL